MRYIIIAAATLLLGACDIIGGPSRPNTSFGFEPAPGPGGFDISFVGALWVTGNIRTPCMPYMLRRDITVRGSSIDISVIGERPTGCVPADSGHLEYTAGIGIGAGNYRVRVYHDWPDVGEWPRELALDTTLTIVTQ